jgi:hypothetical protein
MWIKIQRLDALLSENDFTFLALCRVQRDDVSTVREEQIPRARRFADARDVIHRIKSGMTSTLVRSYNPKQICNHNLKSTSKFFNHTFKIDANLRAIVLECGTFVDILTNLWIFLRSDITAIARTNVPATCQVLAPVFASAVAGIRASAGRVATSLVRFVLTVILQIADKFLWHAIAIGASELLVGITRFGTFSAQCDVVLV